MKAWGILSGILALCMHARSYDSIGSADRPSILSSNYFLKIFLESAVSFWIDRQARAVLLATESVRIIERTSMQKISGNRIFSVSTSAVPKLQSRPAPCHARRLRSNLMRIVAALKPVPRKGSPWALIYLSLSLTDRTLIDNFARSWIVIVPPFLQASSARREELPAAVMRRNRLSLHEI